MKTAISLMILALLVSIPAWCDSIPPAGYLSLNGPGGTFTFSSGQLYADLQPYGGGTFTFSDISHSGYLYLSSPDLSLNGYLSKVFFNPRTRMLQGYFQGRLSEDGSSVIAVHGFFREQFNMAQGTGVWGTMRYGAAPEPSEWLLMVSGLIGVGGMAWRFASRWPRLVEKSDCRSGK
jgi:hypothetical protein